LLDSLLQELQIKTATSIVLQVCDQD